MMDKRSARRKGQAILNLESEIDSKVGRASLRNGQKVFGARRIHRQRRAAIVDMLRAETGIVREVDGTLTPYQLEALKDFWWQHIEAPNSLSFSPDMGGAI
jgi:hypothetical protein